MTTLDLLKRGKPDWQLFRQRSSSEPRMAPLVAHIGSVPIPSARSWQVSQGSVRRARDSRSREILFCLSTPVRDRSLRSRFGFNFNRARPDLQAVSRLQTGIPTGPGEAPPIRSG